jgi:hypothetical protein
MDLAAAVLFNSNVFLQSLYIVGVNSIDLKGIKDGI